MESIDGGMLLKRLAALLLAASLGGCVTDGVGSVKDGDCKLFSAPKYAIRGATQHDQDWIDPTIEGGVGGCKWARPAPRPAEWDAVPAKRKALAVAPAPKKRSVAARVKARIWPVAVPVTPAPPEATTAPEPPASAPPAPRSRIDELLHPVH